MIETKKRNWWAIGTFIFLAVAILWVLLGAFSMVLGSEGDYVSEFSTSAHCIDAKGMEVFGATIWLGQPWSDEVYVYDTSGNYISTKSPSSGEQRSFASDGNFIYGVDFNNDRIYKYNMDFTPVSNWLISDYNPLNANPWGITTNGTYFWVSDGADSEIYRYNMDGTYIDSFDVSEQIGSIADITTNGYFIYASNQDGKIYKYKVDGTYLESFDISGSGATGYMAIGIDDDSDYLYVASYLTDKIYVFEAGGTTLVGKVWGVDPVSGTEITDLNTPFEFGWGNLDDWDILWVNFQNRPTGIFTEGQEILITTSPSGSAVLNLTDFNFDRYGTFYFHAVAGREVMEVIEGMFITGKYISEWTDDLVDPEYNLILTTTTGLAPIFEMSDFEAWYGTNAKFDEPTDMFSAIAGFFDPIFNKIGEFGNRIKDYFNVNEAYSQGYEIGKAVPYFTYFVGQVSLFLGGFPIMKWLFVIVLLLTGIFIFRLIMKFIPFLGN